MTNACVPQRSGVSPTCRRRSSRPARPERTSRSAALTKYSAGWPLYENFDLDIPKHKIVSVFGPNGCGKAR